MCPKNPDIPDLKRSAPSGPIPEIWRVIPEDSLRRTVDNTFIINSGDCLYESGASAAFDDLKLNINYACFKDGDEYNVIVDL